MFKQNIQIDLGNMAYIMEGKCTRDKFEARKLSQMQHVTVYLEESCIEGLSHDLC